MNPLRKLERANRIAAGLRPKDFQPETINVRMLNERTGRYLHPTKGWKFRAAYRTGDLGKLARPSVPEMFAVFAATIQRAQKFAARGV